MRDRPVTAILTAADGSAELADLYTARAALERSRDLAEIKHIRDTALAARRYAEAKKLGAVMTGYAQEIVNRAERRIGQLLAETPNAQGQRTDLLGTRAAPSPHQQAGKKLSARAQLLAELPDADFEKLVTKPVTRVARIARDRRAEGRRREQAQGAGLRAKLIIGWRETEDQVTLASRLRLFSEHVLRPQIHADSQGVIYASGYLRPAWMLDGLDKLDSHVPGLAGAIRAEIDAAVSAYENALTAAVERAGADADRIAGMLRTAASEAPDVVVDTIRGHAAITEEAGQ